MWLLLILCVSTALAQPDSCGQSGLVFFWWEMVGMYYVRYDASPCDGPASSWPFCEDSGWGNEEATVVCREQGFSYGLGRYVLVHPLNGGYRSIECDGSENRLADCEIGPFSNQECRYVAVVTQCSNVPQVYVTGLVHNELFPYHLTVGEEQESLQVCLEVVGANSLTQPLHVTLTTIPTSGGIFQSATASSDYLPLSQTLVFESSTTMMSERCLEIEVVDDLLSEPWEMFSVLISTNSSAVEIVNSVIDVYIKPNDEPATVTIWSSGSLSPTLQPRSVTISSSPTSYHTSLMSTFTSSLSASIATNVNAKSSVIPVISTSSLSTAKSSITPEISTSSLSTAKSLITPEISTSSLSTTKSLITPEISTSSLSTTTATIGVYTSSVTHSKAPVIIRTTSTPASSAPPIMNSRKTTSNGLVIGVTVAVVLVLTSAVTLVLVSLILWLRRKTKRLNNKKPTSPQLSLDAKQSEEESKRLSLTNPTYQPTAFQSSAAVEERAGSPEHDFTNPLYTPVAVSGSSDSTPARPPNTDYEYIETGFTGE